MTAAADDAAVLVEFQRGGTDRIETRHRGSIAVVDADGTLVFQAGDPHAAYALRSTAKPFQLLPLMLDGLHQGNGGGSLEAADLAVMMSSHNGESMHTERITALLARFGLTPEALKCGVEPPALRADRERLLRANETPSALHCNCSGKHTNMLAVCSRRGWPLETYLQAQHPLQLRIRDILGSLAGRPQTPLRHSVDGCSLPTYWMPLAALARMFAFIAEPGAAPAVEGRSIESALLTLRDAGTRHPELIAGSGRLDTRLMQSLGPRLFAKTGAAGLYALALPAGGRLPKALGVAVKVEDGDPKSRIRACVVVEVLRQLGVVLPGDGEAWADMERIAGASEHNFRGLEVGTYRAVFSLESTGAGP